MKTPNRALPFFAWLVIQAGPAIAQDLPGPDEYAWGFPVELADESEYFAVDVPWPVYRSVSDHRLRDAGVYNADGQPVPRMFEPPAGDAEGVENEVTLGLVPLHGREADDLSRLRLMLHRIEGGTTLELDAADIPERDAESPLVAYIADARDLEETFEALELGWPAAARGFIGHVSVHGSDDLQDWRPLGSGTVADLEYEGLRITESRVSLAGQSPEYLRITWRDMPPGWSLEGVRGIYTSEGTPLARDEVVLDPQGPGESEREYVFDAGGFPPVDRVNVELPDENVVIRASIYHRRTGEEQWRLAHNGIFYNVSRHGHSVRSPAVPLPAIRSGQWKVQVESGLAPDPVRLRLAWRPDRLLFLAQGPRPFELVAGRARDRIEQFPQDSVLGDRSIFRMLKDAGGAGAATLGERRELAGPGSLEFSDGATWRTALLWIGLFAAVGLVGWLVGSLMRDLRGARD